MFLQQKLSRTFFSAITSILLVLLIGIYWYSVPLINKEVYKIEKNASRLVLNNVFELASTMQLNLKPQKEEVVHRLRQIIKNSVIAKTGYLFIFDEQGNMLHHPNPNINGTNALQLKDPKTGKPILQELIAVADTGKELEYLWDKPSDANNYSYSKLSLVRHLPELGWYICSSVYIDELQSSGKLLSQRILTMGFITFMCAIFLALIFSYWVTKPINTLALIARKVSQGDLTVTSGISRTDELGILGKAFDDMVEQMRENIEMLDLKVASRTQTLATTNAQLQQALSESQQAQQQLAQVQHINAVGQLAGGLAHDFNNILTIILGNLLAAQQDNENNRPLLLRLLPAIKASRKGSDITNRLLAFSRRQYLVPCRVNIKALIDETIELLKGSLPSKITINIDYSCDNLQVYVDANQLENCLINLVLNAKDAMPNGGIITIIVNKRVVNEFLQFDEEVTFGDYLDVTITDDGNGFSEQAINKAFEPFFTTKDTHQGSGLGLSMVFGFIKQSQGYIRIANQQNGGAKISLLLPLLTYEEENNSKAILHDDTRITKETGFSNKLILLVEDDHDVRAIIREQLISFGLNVIEANDSDEAEQLIDTINDLYGMVSDISMPGNKDGFELATLLKSRSPNCKIVLMSGYFQQQQKPNKDTPILLKKPFVASKLFQALQ
ncbi:MULTISPECIES: cache domain-containing protein [Colwellia]|uniref:histidine kinase n=1 Tax=Colwellia psychrerythraea (strain 34H / ATCC BAA-681) TaxID=167879 RepID=Q47WB2_COLP3|nr:MULTISPECIES: cache domain-containing protein [Colwellia]AAZ26919.1 sensor histidine kinase/response regulator [Colwellia psychrerythraea 34H]PKH85385.1 PAS sensor protein [Colwellia sp. Bg11-28]